MKKILGIIVLGLLWQNLVLANDLAISVFNKWLYDNGHQKYVFYSPHKGNNPYMSAQTPNNLLQRLGYQGEQDIHGFRHVITNTLGDKKGKNESSK